jgi:apolipoprotein N-acyltransferase
MKRKLLLSVGTAILLTLSYAPFKTGFLAYIALVPYFYLLESLERGETFRWSYFSGFLYALGTLYWIGWVTLPGMIGTLLVWPLYISLYSALHIRLRRRTGPWAYLLIPFLWTAIEYLQSLGELAFPWNTLGYTQSGYLPFVQFAEYTAVWGVSFWLVCINTVVFVALRPAGQPYRKWFALILVVLFLVPLAHGLYVLSNDGEHRSVKVTLMQGNMDPLQKWADDPEKNFLIYEQLMAAHRQDETDLYVWPETATPFYLRSEQAYLNRMWNLVDSAKAPILTGSVDIEFNRDGTYHYFNSALFFQQENKGIQRYAKMKLVPFSERVPYRDFLIFRKIKDLLYDLIWGIGDYTPGHNFTVFTMARKAEEIKFSVPICYESAFPDVVRRFSREGQQFLVVITNDGWFGRTSGPYQHVQIAVFRAIENRTGIARCANTGISCFIDHLGRVSERSALFVEAVQTGRIPLRQGSTFYIEHGDWMPQLALILSVLGLAVSFFKQKPRLKGTITDADRFKT